MIRADDFDDDDGGDDDNEDTDLDVALRRLELVRHEIVSLRQRAAALEQDDRAGQRRRSGNPSNSFRRVLPGWATGIGSTASPISQHPPGVKTTQSTKT